jgi:ubiquinone/menaquinone biosynthesis C-methylase UbiE
MSNTRPSQEHDPVLDEYARIAARYDTRWSYYVEATTRETLARISVQPTDCVLDVGCGTGALLDQLARACPQAQLAGIDPVPEMLGVARRRLASSIDLREAWAERLPWDDASFDIVVSNSVFHYVRQPVVALREMTRVLRPGGRLIITDWCGDYLTCRICDWYLRLFSRAYFKVYRKNEFLSVLKEAGHSKASVERYRISWLWGLMTAKVTNYAV